MSKRPKKPELFMEEAILDDLAQDMDVLEMPLPKKAFQLVGLTVFAIALIVTLRILFLGVVKREFYGERALLNSGKITVVQPERGIILDRFNKPLVKNIPVFRLSLNLVELLKSDEERSKTIEALNSTLNLPPDYIDDLIKEVDLERQNSVTVVRQLDVEQLIKVKNLDLPAIQIKDDYNRQYINPDIFSHVVGYTGPASKNEAEGISVNDTVGKTGLEAYYDEELRGKNGQTLNYRNAKGEIVDKKLLTNPESGYQLYSTIDADFQTYIYNRMNEALRNLGSYRGVSLAIDPRSGEVLAMVSLPGFDNNKITGEDLTNPQRPLFNRAVSGVYTPGSTIKPLVAFAALKEKMVTSKNKIFSAGYIDIPNPYYPDKPSRFYDWRANGWVDIFSAIAKSSNIYFYAAGGGLGDIKGLGIGKLKEYWQKFGLGDKTGVDLISESKGFLPDPATKEKDGGTWRIGDTYNVSIGQGDLLVTPIQLLNYISAIADNGLMHQPFLVKKIVSEDRTIIKENQPKVVKDFSQSIDSLKLVQQGMADAVGKSYGTAHSLVDLPIKVAAKTGSSQIENKTKINAFFVGYAPAGNPQIALLILIENAREGSLNAVPVAKDVLRWYYENRLTRP